VVELDGKGELLRQRDAAEADAGDGRRHHSRQDLAVRVAGGNREAQTFGADLLTREQAVSPAFLVPIFVYARLRSASN
jgi:hypothetical protein